MATTNLFASARAAAVAHGGEGDGKPGEGVVRTAARTSLYCGFGLMGLLLWVARPLIALYIGEFQLHLCCHLYELSISCIGVG